MLTVVFPTAGSLESRLQFVDVVTGETYNAIFNVSLERTRTTKSGKAGERLPKNRFIVQKRSSFVAFWRETGLAFSCSNFINVWGGYQTYVLQQIHTQQRQNWLTKQ